MLTFLGALLGFMTSGFPSVLKLIQDKADRQHELAILDKQLEMQRQGHNQQLVEIQTQADVTESQALYQHASLPSGVKWIEALRASVRPIITYAFFALFVFVKVMTLVTLLQQGILVMDGLLAIWDEETRTLFAAVVTFWFGHRMLVKRV